MDLSSPAGSLKFALKRGALVTAANWQVVLVQFVADTLFKTLLAVPIVGGLVLVALVVGGDPFEMLRLEPSQILSTMVGVLLAQPVALESARQERAARRARISVDGELEALAVLRRR